jgi:[acyl-carrier-protein] S-malonyltransferase
MGAALCDASAAARQVYALADRVTELPITDVCCTGTIEQLTQTEFTQIAVVATSLAAAALLEERLGHVPEARAAAGHSVGELSAMCWAGALTLESTLKLVATRARLMSRDSAKVDGTMVAVLGLAADALVDVCTRASKETGSIVQVANLNAPDQVVLSGERSAVTAAGVLAQAAGASRVLPINVGGPFHSAYMAEAGHAFADSCRATDFAMPRCPIVLNTTAEPSRDPEALRTELGVQITSPVRWSESVQALGAAGTTTFLELGPGRVLSNLVRRTLPGATTMSAGTPESIEEARSLWSAS